MPRIGPVPWKDLTPAQRAYMEAGERSGAFTDLMPMRILAYADHDEPPADGDRRPNFPRHLLGGRLLELLRIRSAQLGACAPCSVSRKAGGITDEDAGCLIDPGANAGLDERERLAAEFFELLANDHHRIGDDLYRRLAEHFTTAEIVELGTTCGGIIGMHRFMHTLDIFGDAPPVIGYDPAQTGMGAHGASGSMTAFSGI
ncbi:MAG: carboxymuconolactone decarboxylase family protein [Alphaproteobacteria bacterium]|nr:carboxymuconolactone decarboxylase family protein [Alphaproteobacteria bacterium]